MNPLRVASRSACPICASTAWEAWFDLQDDRYGQPDRFPLRYCRSCDFAFLGTVIAEADVAELYRRYYPRPAPPLPGGWRSGDSWLGRFARWWDGNLNPAYGVLAGERILDVVCGTGELLAQAAARGATGVGLEADPVAAELARARGGNVLTGTLDLCPELQVGAFDRIVFNQTLEHLNDPVAALKQAAALLAPGGSVAIAAPHLNAALRRWCGARWISWHAPYHVSHFSALALRRAAERAGLRLRSFRCRTPANWLLMQMRRPTSSGGRPDAGFRTSFPLWQRALVAPLGRFLDRLGCGEGFLAAMEAHP